MDYCLLNRLVEIVNRIKYDDIQWATWIGSIAALCAVNYTKKIWINNLYRNEIKDITELHNRLIKNFMLETEIVYLPEKDSNKLSELLFYKKHFNEKLGKGKLGKGKLDFSEYIARLESTEAIKNKNISVAAKNLRKVVSDLEFYFNGFICEIDAAERSSNLNDKNIFIHQATRLHTDLKSKKPEYDLYYRELKQSLVDGIYKI